MGLAADDANRYMDAIEKATESKNTLDDTKTLDQFRDFLNTLGPQDRNEAFQAMMDHTKDSHAKLGVTKDANGNYQLNLDDDIYKVHLKT